MPLIVYGKKKTEKRYKPFDMKDNKFVINLIHASMFSEDQKEELEEEVRQMNILNKDYQFEIRKKG